MTTELTDTDYNLADQIEAVLEAGPAAGLTPSAVAAKVTGTSTDEARDILRWLVEHGYAHTSGNGAWTHYHAGRL
jgi:hypothetical protein